MKKFNIKHRITGKVLFSLKRKSMKICIEKAVSLKIDLRGADLRGAYLTGADLRGAYLRGADLTGAYLTGADLTGAYLTGAYLTGADLRGADLTGAYLRGAYLRGAYLRGAYLRGAYLTGADLRDWKNRKVDLSKKVLQILGLSWDIVIFDAHLKIGCEFHKISEWVEYSDERISEMEPRALEFWKASKEMIIGFCHANGRK